MARNRSKPLAVSNIESVANEVAQLRDLDLKGLRASWKGVFRSTAPMHLPRHLLIGILAYRLQTEAFGDLAPEIRQFLSQINSKTSQAEAEQLISRRAQRQADLRVGTVLSRVWNGSARRVMVIADGFAWNGATYDSLSAVAFAITGTRWNGHRFFGLRDKLPAVNNPVEVPV